MARRKRIQDQGRSLTPSTVAQGGTWCPVSHKDAARIAQSALQLLCEPGIAGAPQAAIDVILAEGGQLSDGRLCYPLSLIEAALAKGPGSVLLAGRDPCHDLHVGGAGCYAGTGGAAPSLLDMKTGCYRPSTLEDLYNAARLADALPHIRFFSRSLVARDMKTQRDLDLNTAYAALSGTQKHVMVQASTPDHVREIAALCYAIAGSEAGFRNRPFLSLNINHVIPPLRFHTESVLVLIEAVKAGIPIHCNVFGQLGASSPVTLAGSVAQTLAETLAGLALVHALDPNAPRIAGPRPMITDLRTGGMAGGSGEQAMATALCVQVLRHWNMPCSVIAGATDSKVPDAQAGYEKALNVNTAIQAGANLITQAAGMQAGLMGVSFAAMVVDNEMIGSLMRANVPPEITEETLNLNMIKSVLEGDGHFLGHAETYQRMKSDFLYPDIADRRTIEEWVAAGSQDMARCARTYAEEILQAHTPPKLDPRFIEKFSLSPFWHTRDHNGG